MSETHFAPAERLDSEALSSQILLVQDSELINTFLGAIAGILLVLNEQRQIIALNNSFLEKLGIDDPEKVLGLRLGESLRCVHAAEMDGGCGTSRSCGSCGAVIAMMSSLTTDEPAERICALEFSRDGVVNNLALRVRTATVVVDGTRLLLVTVLDITQEHNRATLERVFHHDMNNILTSILGPSELLARDTPWRWEVRQIRKAARRLQQEIVLQRELSLEGTAGFIPEKSLVSLYDINQDLELLLHGHRAARERTIEMELGCDDCLIHTDKMLVSRVLANMLINGLEATARGGVVRFTTTRLPGKIHWQVWNDACIPKQIQGRIFQRYFSTKQDTGRGTGTFSMKLFGESYLGGNIEFTSSKESGTVFSFTLPTQQLDKDSL